MITEIQHDTFVYTNDCYTFEFEIMRSKRGWGIYLNYTKFAGRTFKGLQTPFYQNRRYNQVRNYATIKIPQIWHGMQHAMALVWRKLVEPIKETYVVPTYEILWVDGGKYNKRVPVAFLDKIAKDRPYTIGACKPQKQAIEVYPCVSSIKEANAYESMSKETMETAGVRGRKSKQKSSRKYMDRQDTKTMSYSAR